jgi:hypothetical protein
MFLVLGFLTIVVGLFTIILMPDNPMSVKWLSDAEKAAAIQRVAVNQTGIKNIHFKWSHLKELVMDVQIWLLVILITLVRRDLRSCIIAKPTAAADLDLLRGNHNILRNRYPQFWIFFSTRCPSQYAKWRGQRGIRYDSRLFCGQAGKPMVFYRGIVHAGSFRCEQKFNTPKHDSKP